MSLCVALPARAERLAVLAVEVSGAPPVTSQAEHVASILSERGHRVMMPAEVAARLGWDASAVGPEWAVRELRAVDLARAALTRLDRRAAGTLERTLAQEIVGRGGGAAGNELLVEWCLLEHQLAATGGDSAAARLWLDRAAAMGPSVQLDVARHPIDEVEQFERRKSVLLHEAPATFSVATTPPAADVWIDGARRCSSPCSVKLPPGRHLALMTLVGHGPATLDVTLGPGSDTVRKVALSATYDGVSPREAGQMLTNPSRRAEGANALEHTARFLDVDHVIALVPEASGTTRLIVAPPAAGRPPVGPAASSERELDAAVLEQLRPISAGITGGSAAAAGPWAIDRSWKESSGARTPKEPYDPTVPKEPKEQSDRKEWYAKPGTWIAGGVTVAAIVGAVLIYGATRTPTGTLTIDSPP